MKTILNFKDSDTFRRLERQAYDGTLDVSDFPPAEYKYFNELHIIYYNFRIGRLTKSDAECRKLKLLHDYYENLQKQENFLNVYKYYQGNIRKSGMLRAEIQKSYNIAEIALLACKVISLMTDEPTFAKLQERKIKELIT